MKKVGIITYHDSINYGALLQTYALQKKIEDLGYEVFFEEFGSGHDYLCWGEYLARGLIYLLGK